MVFRFEQIGTYLHISLALTWNHSYLHIDDWKLRYSHGLVTFNTGKSANKRILRKYRFELETSEQVYEQKELFPSIRRTS